MISTTKWSSQHLMCSRKLLPPSHVCLMSSPACLLSLSAGECVICVQHRFHEPQKLQKKVLVCVDYQQINCLHARTEFCSVSKTSEAPYHIGTPSKRIVIVKDCIAIELTLKSGISIKQIANRKSHQRYVWQKQQVWNFFYLFWPCPLQWLHASSNCWPFP